MENNAAIDISIVIPTKNERDYIGPTIEQFRDCLEKFNLEIIVSDAYSTDGTAEVVQAYHREFGDRVRLVQGPGKQNIAIGRNYGAEHARGQILFHSDADVRIPNRDKFFTTVLAKFRQTKIVAATMPIWVYPEERSWADRLYHILMNTMIRISFTLGVYLAKGECQLVRRSIFEHIGGYNEKIVAGEDCNLFYRLHKEGRIAYLYRLSVHHSPRRFRQYGYLRLTMIYVREGISLLFRGKSWSEEWTPVR
jgi:glycosyltransferase involved in cell wall biosynthesis